MANKAITGKASSVRKVESGSNASVTVASKPKAKTSERHASVKLVSSGSKTKNAPTATSTVTALSTSRAKARKNITIKNITVVSTGKAPKKTARKTALLLNTAASSSEAGSKVSRKAKSLETKPTRHSKDVLQQTSEQNETMEIVSMDAHVALKSEGNELAQIMAFNEEDARMRGKSSAAPDDASIKIFQIYYHDRQLPFLDPDLDPYDNAEDKSPLLEFNVFAKLLQSNKLHGARLWGALSWKFGQKTGLTGARFKKEIAANPGYDVYFCNPHAEIEALYHNLWLQGEVSHPNFIALSKEIFEVAGLPAELLTEIQPSLNFATANYFVATPSFWKRYAAFVSRILLVANKKLSPTARAIMFSSTADPSGVHAEASYIPFIVERLFSVFLRTEGHDFRAYKISPQDSQGPINVHLKLLSEMRNLACRTKSAWMASCWVNYRNLYLTNTHGAQWAQRYLKGITPQSVVFAPEADNITSGEVSK